MIVDYPQYYPVAPGIVLIKARGHSAPITRWSTSRCSRAAKSCTASMSAGCWKISVKIKGKAAPWVKEDVPAVIGQLRWLNNLHRNEKNVTILVTHDDALFTTLTQERRTGRRIGF